MSHTILSVDDNTAAGARNQVLRKAGFEVIEAATGTDALKLASEKRPALVALSIELPGMDGFAVAKRLKSEPRTASIPVLHLSRRGKRSRDYPESLKSGAEGYLRLPVEPAVLIGAVTALIEAHADGSERKRAEEALRASEERLQLFVEHAPAAIAMFDRQMRYTAASRRWVAEYALGGQDLIGRCHYDVFPEIPEPWKEAHRRCLAGAVEKCDDEPFPRANGELDWVRWEIHPWRDGKGEIGGIIIFSERITDRKREEEERQRLTRELVDRVGELQAVLDAAPVAIWIAHDPRCLRITGNAFADRMVMQTARGGNVSASAPAGEAVVSFRAFREGVELRPEELPAQVAAATGRPVKQQEQELVFADGRRVRLLLGGVPLFDAEGRVRGSVAAGTDVTELRRAEEALRATALFPEQDPAPVLRVGGDGALLYANPSSNELMAEWKCQVGRMVPDDLRHAVEQALAQGAPAEFDVRVGGRDYSFVVAPVAGRRWANLYGRDMTGRNRAEEALRESEAVLRSFFDSPGLMRGVVELVEGRVVHVSCNAAWAEMCGVERESIAGKSAAETGAPEEVVQPWVALYEESWRTGKPVSMEYGRPDAEGRERWLLATAGYLGIGHSGNPRFAYTILDLTERKRAERALRESESRERARAVELEALMDAAPAVIFVAHEPECRYMTGNRAAYDLLRMPPGGNLSKCPPDGKDPTKFRAMKDGIEMTLAEFPVRKAASTGQRVRDYEYELVFEDGASVILLGDAVPMLDEDGRPRGAVGVFVDITGRKRAEERLREAQKLESLGLLAGGVAHDFNNLLVGVIGNASLAQEMLSPDHPAGDLLEGVMKAGEQAAHLTRQMLAYAGKGKFLVEALNLSSVIPEMAALVRTSISKKIALRLDLEDDLPPVEADRGQLQQVFMNLALNAAEAIGGQDGLIAIKAGVQEVDERYARLHPEATALPPGRCVRLEVRDTCCGMDEATRARIFDPFFSTKFTGRGLGLAAVAGILRGHRGAIMVSSTPGKGSCFTVLLPVAAGAAEERPAAARGPAPHGSGAILVVDDEKLVREMVKRVLERHGYTVLLAESGLAALDLLRRYIGAIALVLLDLNMPRMSGEEALAELRKIRPEVKVLVSSGYSESETMALFKGQPVTGFIQKPYTVAGLAERVRICLG
ncbi:MAG: PAS domain-containing protein [Bryobacteraceae bacterium]